jgi:hypothetical protein
MDIYTIVKAHSHTDLINKVNEHIENGYDLVGGVSSVCGEDGVVVLFQAMAKSPLNILHSSKQNING